MEISAQPRKALPPHRSRRRAPRDALCLTDAKGHSTWYPSGKELWCVNAGRTRPSSLGTARGVHAVWSVGVHSAWCSRRDGCTQHVVFTDCGGEGNGTRAAAMANLQKLHVVHRIQAMHRPQILMDPRRELLGDVGNTAHLLDELSNNSVRHLVNTAAVELSLIGLRDEARKDGRFHGTCGRARTERADWAERWADWRGTGMPLARWTAR